MENEVMEFLPEVFRSYPSPDEIADYVSIIWWAITKWIFLVWVLLGGVAMAVKQETARKRRWVKQNLARLRRGQGGA